MDKSRADTAWIGLSPLPPSNHYMATLSTRGLPKASCSLGMHSRSRYLIRFSNALKSQEGCDLTYVLIRRLLARPESVTDRELALEPRCGSQRLLVDLLPDTAQQHHPQRQNGLRTRLP